MDQKAHLLIVLLVLFAGLPYCHISDYFKLPKKKRGFGSTKNRTKRNEIGEDKSNKTPKAAQVILNFSSFFDTKYRKRTCNASYQ